MKQEDPLSAEYAACTTGMAMAVEMLRAGDLHAAAAKVNAEVTARTRRRFSAFLASKHNRAEVAPAPVGPTLYARSK